MKSRINNLDDFFENTESVGTFAKSIIRHLESNTSTWLEISEILARANAQFGFSSKKMKSLIFKVGFSESKANKLIKIAESDQLQKNKEAVAKVNSWTVLYELSALSEEKFEKVLQAIDADKVISIAWINEVLGRRQKPRKGYRQVFSIEVDLDALKTMDFDSEKLEMVEDVLQKLKDAIPELDVVYSGILEKLAAKRAKAWSKAYHKVLRRMARKAVEEYIASSPEWISYPKRKKAGISNLVPPSIGIYSDVEEVYSGLETEQDKVFENLGADWFDNDNLMGEVEQEVQKRMGRTFGQNDQDPRDA